MAQGHPTAAAMASYRRFRLPFARPQTLQTLQTLQNVRPTPQAKGTPTSSTRATPAGKSHHKATAMAQGHPPAAAMASYRRSRLPFARPQTLQTLQKSAQLRREKVPQQAQHAPLPHAKATTRPQQWLKGTPRPQQWLLIGVQGCRLPGLKPSKSPPSSAGKRYPNKLNTRHARRQKPPQGHSNGSRAPPGRSNGFLHSHCLTLAHLAEFKLIRVHLAAGCNFSLLEKQTAICLSCCPSPSVSLQYPPSN